LVSHVKGRTQIEVFENKVLRRIFVPQRSDMTRDWRKLHNEALCNLHSSPYTIRMIRSKRISKAGHVARMGAMRNAMLENLKGRDHSEDLGVDGRILLKRIIRKRGGVWILLVWLRIRGGRFL
jgi:hypothetical protein